MRNNQPVTQREYVISDDATLMSTTDERSYITYANEAFVAASGFTLDELRNQPHNLVRHPDMPKEAFEDMWNTLKAGEPWTALAKNRRKDGDHYWVRANATPIKRNGHTTGYMSVRTKPSREEVNAAEQLYAEFRNGRAGSRKFHKGVIVRKGLLGFTSVLRTMSVRWRIRNTLAFMVVAGVLLETLLGVSGSSLALFAAAMGGLAVLASWFLEAQIARPLEQVRDQALRISSGDSRKAVVIDRVDEIGVLLRTVNQLGLMFRWLVTDVDGQVESVRSAATEISSGNHNLSAQTEQAAANLQQTAASMEEMTATVHSNANITLEAGQLSQRANEAADAGGEAVQRVIDNMKDISQSAAKIAEITALIDGIAFQTNILSLNAAVEAARAGEQGRGFAVVATEVRSLAQRSAAAAKEIKSLIDTSTQRVELGATLAGKAGAALTEAKTQSHKLQEMLHDIGSATTQQNVGVQQIGEAVANLDQVTQQNAALVEETAAASQSLQNQAERLSAAVGVFR